jgi:hypothetical protein
MNTCHQCRSCLENPEATYCLMCGAILFPASEAPDVAAAPTSPADESPELEALARYWANDVAYHVLGGVSHATLRSVLETALAKSPEKTRDQS